MTYISLVTILARELVLELYKPLSSLVIHAMHLNESLMGSAASG